uniref:Synaptonemal complex protein 1 n=1 Tax=Esox lucius TaxID=8010 RepID=A0A3P8Z1W8_ESOLU
MQPTIKDQFCFLGEMEKKKDSQLQILEDELDVKTKVIESQVEQIKVVEIKTSELTTELEEKYAEINKLKSKIQDIEGQLSAAMRRNETSMKNIEKLKADIVQYEVKYEELSVSFSQLQLEKNNILEQIQNESSEATILAAQVKQSEAKEMKLKKQINTIEEEKDLLREELKSVNARIEEQGQDTDNLQKKLTERCENLQTEISQKEKQMKAVEKKNKTLKKQIAIGTAKSNELENEINKLKEESEDLKQSNEEERKRLLDDLEMKSTSEAELHRKLQKLQHTATEALDSKEDAEIKCQNKIADMVALMEKHKKQYDRMVEEKDAELNEKKRNNMEATANRTSMELELSQKKIENDHLREQLEKEIMERESLLKEIKDLKKEIKSQKCCMQLETQDKQLPEPMSKEVRCSETPKVSSIMRHVSRVAKDMQRKQRTPKVSETPFQSSDKKVAVTPNINEIEKEAPITPSWSSITRVGATPQKETKSKTLKTPSWHSTSAVGSTPRIKSYRIRTPPSLEKSMPWGKSTLELDPKSDSSEHNDLLQSFAVVNEPSKSSLQSSVPAAQHHKGDLFRKIQSPAIHKSPGSALKLAAMKRMRDAGWTAVTGANKKKKKAVEKIFA